MAEPEGADMSQTPDFSIITPVYNAAATIVETIKTVQNQTSNNWEMIIIDDGSTDNSGAIIRQVARSDPRIQLYQQDNRGPSAARNHGLRYARGKYLAFLDGDDKWASERLTGMAEAFCLYPTAGVLFSRTRFIDATSGSPGTLTRHYPELTLATLLAENPVCSTSNIVCRASIMDRLGGFRSELKFAEDQDWLVRVALDGSWAIRGIDAEWFYYRSSLASQSTDLDALRRGWLDILARAADIDNSLIMALRQRAYGPYHRQLARRALRLHRPTLALKYLTDALVNDPGLIIRQPKRTGFTLLMALVSLLPSQTLKRSLAR